VSLQEIPTTGIAFELFRRFLEDAKETQLAQSQQMYPLVLKTKSEVLST
jgi:hypothetical protein